jgi:cell division protease FtsH
MCRPRPRHAAERGFPTRQARHRTGLVDLTRLNTRSRVNVEERRIVAYHEMGHALVASALKGTDPVHKISIIPRGIGALGYTMQRPTEDRFLISRTDLENRMAVLMGGRSAEEIIFGEVSTGAADDLDRTTEIARAMVTRFGMDSDLGQMVYEPKRQSFLGDNPFTTQAKSYSEDTGREIDVAIRKLVNSAYERATEVLVNRRSELETGAALLLEKETLTPDEFPPLRPSTVTDTPAKLSAAERQDAAA